MNSKDMSKPHNNKPLMNVKLINFGNIINFTQDKYHKKQYQNAEYLSPEQIQKCEEVNIM
jgi:hypothetical protein